MTKISVIFLLTAYFLIQTNSQISKTSNRPGAYVPRNDGKYVPDNSGQYKHVTIPALPYKPQNIPALKPGDYSYKGNYAQSGGYAQKGGYSQKGGYVYQGGYQNKYFPTSPVPIPTVRTTQRPFTAKPPPKSGNLNLGPKDHLRFMLDFNFNDGGWQIVQFDWNRDDDYGRLKPKYNYVNERKLFNVQPKKLESHMNGYFYGAGPNDRVHLDGVLNKDVASFNYTESNPSFKVASNANVRETIGEVLEYVKRTILPKLG